MTIEQLKSKHKQFQAQHEQAILQANALSAACQVMEVLIKEEEAASHPKEEEKAKRVYRKKVKPELVEVAA